MQYTNPDGLTLEVPGYLDVLDMDADFKAFVDSLPDFGPVNVVAVGSDHLVNSNDDSKLFATPADCQLRLSDGLPTGFQIAAWSEEGFITLVGNEQIEQQTEIPPDLVGIVTKVKITSTALKFGRQNTGHAEKCLSTLHTTRRLTRRSMSKPTDLLFPSNYTDQDTAVSRAKICNVCDRLFRPTFSCKECGCFMKAKVKLKDATCPLGKW